MEADAMLEGLDIPDREARRVIVIRDEITGERGIRCEEKQRLCIFNNGWPGDLCTTRYKAPGVRQNPHIISAILRMAG